MKYNDVKFSELVKDTLNVKDLSNVIGGQLSLAATMTDGCASGICSVKINPEFCDGGAVCTRGVAG